MEPGRLPAGALAGTHLAIGSCSAQPAANGDAADLLSDLAK